MNRRNTLCLLAAAVLACTGAMALPAAAQDIAQISAYSGPDRTQKLLEGAKKEGTLTIYTSAQTNDIGALVEPFEKKYGIKVSVWRSSSENVLQRIVTEARGNRFTADVVETNGPELEAISREKLFAPVKSPYQADLIPQALRSHGGWVGTRLNVFVQAYNTGAVRKADLPKKWEDLTDPKWKGKLGIEQSDSDWLQGEVSEMGEQKAVSVFKDIVAKNGISVRKGHTLLTQLVVSGEIPMALTVYNYKAEQLKKKGAPIDWFSIGPAIARPNGVGVAARAPHPYSALLFYDFEISPEGQKILETRDFVPTSRKVDSPLAKIPMKFVDAAETLDKGKKYEKMYDDIFVRGAH
ncbi:MAG TPA: extracellular solute-binding protein [Usitatibacter sp.]|jgi:iron(III) transport system substrate-binding protein|nr:extracellular solute-binding protein [Usitatibacter sp.]